MIKNGLTVSSIGERGLLGVAFDPNSSTNNRVYVYYTTAGTPIHNRVSRFTANGDFAPSNTETDDRTVLEDFVLTLTRP